MSSWRFYHHLWKKKFFLIEKSRKYASGRVIVQIWTMAHWGVDFNGWLVGLCCKRILSFMSTEYVLCICCLFVNQCDFFLTFKSGTISVEWKYYQSVTLSWSDASGFCADSGGRLPTLNTRLALSAISNAAYNWFGNWTHMKGTRYRLEVIRHSICWDVCNIFDTSTISHRLVCLCVSRRFGLCLKWHWQNLA